MKIRDIGLIILSGIIFRYGINLLDFLFKKWTIDIDNSFALKNIKTQSKINDIDKGEYRKNSYLTAEFPISVVDGEYVEYEDGDLYE